MKTFKVYTKPTCPFCTKTKRLIKDKGDTYEELQVGKDIDREVYLTKFFPRKTVPMIVLIKDGETSPLLPIGGYEELANYYGKQ